MAEDQQDDVLELTPEMAEQAEWVIKAFGLLDVVVIKGGRKDGI